MTASYCKAAELKADSCFSILQRTFSLNAAESMKTSDNDQKTSEK